MILSGFLSLEKNRNHTALFIQNGYLKLLIRKGPISSNDKITYASEWMWKVPQVNDDQWHSYKVFVNYPHKVRPISSPREFSSRLLKIDLYIDEQLIVANDENFKIIDDYALPTIVDTQGTVLTLGACWHGKQN